MQPLIQHKNRTVRVDQVRVAENALAKTYLNANMAASSGTLTVKDIAGFAVGKYVWINPFRPNSEIIAVHSSTAPSGSTITLASNTSFAHSVGEEVLYVEFNQVVISHAATLGGSKSDLVTTGLLAREKEYRYLDVSQTSGYYFARFKDSVATLYSGYSDGIEYGGWDANTVGYMIDSALQEIDVEFSERLTIQDCLRWINKGLREIKGKLRKWPEHTVSDYVAGQTLRGTNVVTLPTNIYDNETNRSILAVRIGDNWTLDFIDTSAFDEVVGDVNKTQVRTQATSGSTTLEIDNSYDFDDSGTVTVYISGTKYDITYTGVTRSATAGVLTGIPASGEGSITVTIPVDTYVWQDETEGTPLFYTIRNGALEFWPLVDAELDNQNVYMDYNAQVTAVDGEGDTIDFQRYDMLEDYLTWRVWCFSQNNGALDRSNHYYLQFKESLNDAIRTTVLPRKITRPRINRIII
jgi:hypothetical protein